MVTREGLLRLIKFQLLKQQLQSPARVSTVSDKGDHAPTLIFAVLSFSKSPLLTDIRGKTPRRDIQHRGAPQKFKGFTAMSGSIQHKSINVIVVASKTSEGITGPNEPTVGF